MKLMLVIALLGTGILGADTFCPKNQNVLIEGKTAVKDLTTGCGDKKKNDVIPGMI